jgi:hypothetical protein
MANKPKPSTAAAVDGVSLPQLPRPTEIDYDIYVAALQKELVYIYGDIVQEYFESQSKSTKSRFMKQRREYALMVDAFVQKGFAALANSLEANDEELSAGINNLKREREKLEDAAKLIDTIATIISVVARVVALSA